MHAQNIMLGSVKRMDGANQLSTIIVSSNHLSCTAPEIEHNTKLGNGEFYDPSEWALFKAGQHLAQIAQVNPFLDFKPESYDNIVLVWTGKHFFSCAQT